MERIISEEERIRRAEEVSARRKNRIPANTINTSQKPKISMLSKVFIQVITSMCIFGVIYFMNMNSSFATDKIKPIISEDTDFVGIYNKIDELVKNIGNSINIDEDSKTNQNSIQDENVVDKSAVDTVNIEDEDENKIQDNTLNANLEEIKGQDETNEQTENKILTDVDFIKANANITKPISGTITSTYGERESTDIISSNHEGVDIGTNYGAEIKAAMAGTVEMTSSEGGYGNHLVIVNGEISTLYAHCSKIVVKQGDYIEQGQKIAEVGSTGKSTGPHLHFEIRRNGKTVDPQQIVEL